jgi:hypothetical protein
MRPLWDQPQPQHCCPPQAGRGPRPSPSAPPLPPLPPHLAPVDHGGQELVVHQVAVVVQVQLGHQVLHLGAVHQVALRLQPLGQLLERDAACGRGARAGGGRRGEARRGEARARDRAGAGAVQRERPQRCSATCSPSRPQHAPGGPSTPQHAPARPRRPQAAPGGPSTPQAAPARPSRPQHAPGGPSAAAHPSGPRQAR